MAKAKTKKAVEMSVKIEGRRYKVSKGDILIVAAGVDVPMVEGLKVIKMSDRVEVVDTNIRKSLGLK